MKAVGICDVNPQDMKLRDAINAGVTTAQVVAAALLVVADGKPRMRLAIATARGKATDALLSASKQANLESKNRAVADAWASADEPEDAYAP